MITVPWTERDFKFTTKTSKIFGTYMSSCPINFKSKVGESCG